MKYAVIGGDLRLSNLAVMLADDENIVRVFAMENCKKIIDDGRLIKSKSLKDAIEKSEIIIGSVPFLKSNGEMYATFSEEHIKLDDLIEKNYEDKVFIAGSIPKDVIKKLEAKYSRVIDVMKIEELVILNTIATAEGAIDVAIQNTDTVLHGSNVLILGFGRVAKIVASKFSQLSTYVTCAARKNTDLAWIKALGYDAVNINELQEDLKKYDIIINTVPQMIIDKEEMQFMKPNVLLIDLASSPGGINTEDARNLDLKFVWALALPGKIAPLTSAKFLKDCIYDTLEE